MSKIARLFRSVLPGARASTTWGGTTDLQTPAFWLEDWTLGRRTASGERVTSSSALGLSAYYASLRNGSEDVAKLPREVRQKRRTGRGSDLILDHPLARLLRRPNPIMNWGVFAQVLQHRRMGWGNGYAEIVRDFQGVPVELWPVHAERVRPELDADGRTLVYRVRGEGSREERLNPSMMMHLRGLGTGVEGYSVLRLASETLGLGLAAQRHAAAFFGEGMSKRLVAFTKQTLNADAREALRKRIEGDREANAVGARRMPIVDIEADVRDLGIPPDEAEFLAQREFTVEEVARWFRMQLDKIQYFKRAQGWSSLDAQNTNYVVDFLTPQVQLWEEEIESKLLTDEERGRGIFVRFVMQGLLRGDVSTRISYYGAGFRDGWLSQNDIRDLEDLNPIDDHAADEYRVQAQMTRLSEAGAGAAVDDDESVGRAKVGTLRPFVAHAAAALARKESHEVEAALKRNAKNPTALAKWARTFYEKLRVRAVEALAPVTVAIDAIAARHESVRRPDMDAIARAWAMPDWSDKRPDPVARAKALEDAVFQEINHDA